MTAKDAASERQIEAADPRNCTWLSANAGSGKTRVLTDRVARLLLDDAPPENILCLTYTTAAASEMQNRLFQRLGEWAMLADNALSARLTQLGAEGPLTAETLAKARRLFARAIETPGGLKIQTIHSFCAGLLRRFPLEAGLTPGFSEMDAARTAEVAALVLDRVSAEAPDDFAAMAALVTDSDMTGLCAELSRHRMAFPEEADPTVIHRLFGLPQGYTDADRMDAVLSGVDLRDLHALAEALTQQTATTAKVSDALFPILSDGLTPERLDTLSAILLTAKGEPRKNLLADKRRDAIGPVLSTLLDALTDRILAAAEERAALAASAKTLTLHRFASHYLPAYAQAKAARGLLDFDDLIQQAERLLSRSDLADWVLYRLDGGIDHILVDEAQDTSPLQWRVIEHLTREMTAGDGSHRSTAKTLFVVGDLKQSIYSFQGADPAGFDRMRQTFSRRLGQLGQGLNTLELEYSFRSAAPILDTVDATFHTDNRAGLGNSVLHRPFRSDMPGRVDLWPDIPRTEKPDSGHWTDPVGALSDDHHTALMARRVAGEIARLIAEEVLWDRDRAGRWHPRRITEGDILILVQSRGALFHEIIGACKKANLRVAGADVLRLGEELAVKDLLATLAFLATPEDDLSLAAILRSPLLGWSEAQLFDLATDRAEGDFLWQALRRRAADHPATHGLLSRLRDEADFLRPYDLLERILLREGGRQRLIGRLGDEAADGIDALLSQALAYEQDDVPSLTGFLARMQTTDIDVKRRAEGRGDKLRVMTVHGAKGLESPIVILPDTGQKTRRSRIDDRMLAADDGTPLLRPASAETPQAIAALRDALAIRRAEEGQRLLYVAMTRAEQWLIVGAAGDMGKAGDAWKDQIAVGLDRRGAVDHDFGFGTGQRLDWAWPASVPRPTPPTAAPQPGNLPDWASTPAPRPARPTAALSPSDLGGAKALPGDGALSEEAAKARGTQLHLLLEHLPGHLPATRRALADRLLGNSPEASALLHEAETVLAAPGLAAVFAPDTLAEVELTVPLDGRRLTGTVDRLLIRPDHVRAIDFKSNATVPASAEAIPDGILRQMGAYAVALAQIYPDRRVDTAILWTRTATLMPIPPELAATAFAHIPSTGT